jgi:2-phosphoglycerate kinase
MQIKKKDGSLEPYMPEKVVVAAVKAGAPYQTARDIAASLSTRTESVMTTSDVRKYVLSELRSKGAAKSADSWEAYDSKHKKKKK